MMLKFYVYHGYCDSDHYDSSYEPTHQLTICDNEMEVLALHKELVDNTRSDCNQVYFRVIYGRETFTPNLEYKEAHHD